MAIERLNDIKNERNRQLVSMLQDIIRIPSYVPQDPPEAKLTQNENGVVDYLEKWITENTHLKVVRQELEGGRFNLIASHGRPDLVFLGHTDTVSPKNNAPYNQLAAEIHEGKIWGLGSTDMKSGLASMMQAISLVPDAKNVWALFYADEEYDFLGMKALVKDYADLRPKLLVSSDGGDLAIGHGCRGLIEFRVQIRGVSGHAAKGNGISALTGAYGIIEDLRNYFSGYEHAVMGATSMNLAYIMGGKEHSNSFDGNGKLVSVEQEGNVIPDIAEFVVDVRPSSPDLTVDLIEKRVKEFTESNSLNLKDFKVRHRLNAWYTDLTEIEEFIEIAEEAVKRPVKTENPGKSGYLDLQMFWEVTGKPKALMFGGGKGATAHKPEEHIEINDLIKERDFFLKVLEKYAK